MFNQEAFNEFRQGISLLRDEVPSKAMPHFERAAELDPMNPNYVSYLGLLQGIVEGKWAEAERLCTSALRIEPRQPQFYINLAEVYRLAGRHQDASDALGRGLKHAPRDYRLNLEFSKLVVRRPPVVPRLPRTHFLNRTLGRLRHHALQAIAAL
jgi:Flp pilus assembly protein TadD